MGTNSLYAPCFSKLIVAASGINPNGRKIPVASFDLLHGPAKEGAASHKLNIVP
jgi:hypothetical protein